MNTLRTSLTAAALAALAVGAVLGSAPASAASLQETCIEHPEAYAPFAVTGVYSTQKRGLHRDRICKVYDSAPKLQGVITETDYYFYRLTPSVSPPPVRSPS